MPPEKTSGKSAHCYFPVSGDGSYAWVFPGDGDDGSYHTIQVGGESCTIRGKLRNISLLARYRTNAANALDTP